MQIFVVCRILNKVTPEKFDKLSLELLNVGIDNPVILKGIILLVIFFWLFVLFFVLFFCFLNILLVKVFALSAGDPSLYPVKAVLE